MATMEDESLSTGAGPAREGLTPALSEGAGDVAEGEREGLSAGAGPEREGLTPALSKGAGDVTGVVAQVRGGLVNSGNEGKRNWFVLSMILLAAIIGFGFVCLFTGKSLAGVSLIVGCLITKLGTLIDYMYGSSQGSKDKDKMNEKSGAVGDSVG